MKWYTMTKPDAAQGLIADEETGANIAVSYDPKHAQLIAAAPDLLENLKEARDFIDALMSQEMEGALDLLTNSGEDVLHAIYNAIFAATIRKATEA